MKCEERERELEPVRARPDYQNRRLPGASDPPEAPEVTFVKICQH